MDRREALKRLGVGGAIVVSAPLLLESYAVAQAASGDPFIVDPPAGVDAVPALPPTPKANSVRIAFDTGAFGGDPQDLVFFWTLVSASPPITIDEQVVSDGSIADLTKRNGRGKMNKFTIEVAVWRGTDQIATYQVLSDGSTIVVDRISPAGP